MAIMQNPTQLVSIAEQLICSARQRIQQLNRRPVSIDCRRARGVYSVPLTSGLFCWYAVYYYTIIIIVLITAAIHDNTRSRISHNVCRDGSSIQPLTD